MKKKICILLGIVCIASSLTAFAGGMFENYSVIVGKFNGSAYTDYQVKQNKNRAGHLNSSKVGSDYTVDVRMIDENLNGGKWVTNVGDDTLCILSVPSRVENADNVGVKFSNDLTTPVKVECLGNWASN